MSILKAEMRKKITNSCIICGYCNDPGVSFFTFPKDSDRRKEWMKNLRLADSVDIFHRRVCSKHFSREDFLKCGNAGRRMLLKKTSVPQLNESSSNEDFFHEKSLNCSRKLGRFRKNRRVAHSCYICRTNRNEAVSYFNFPSERNLKLYWMEACNINAATCISNLILCNKHFLDNDFVNEGKSTLKKNAIPTQFMQPSTNIKKSTHSCIICGASKLEKPSYFGLPKAEEMKLLWEKACGFQMPKSDCQYRICSKHFVPDDFTNDPKAAKRLRLKKTAIPSLYLSVQRKSAVKKQKARDKNKVEVLEIVENSSINEMKLFSPSVSDPHFVKLPIPGSESDEQFSAEEFIEDFEYSVKNESLYFHDCTEEIIPPISVTSSETNRCFRLQREIMKKQQKDIEKLQQQLRKARQKIRILEGLGVQLQEMNTGAEDTTVYVMVV